ncbi:MAG: phosphatase PAP2 family protein [Candidatus Micrarchaeia archaeon]
MYYLSYMLVSAYNLGINIYAFQLMKAIASPLLTSIMTALGKSFLVVLPLVALYLYLKKEPNTYSFILAGVLLYLISDSIKMIVAEPRPCNIAELSWINKVSCENSFSFPSNHASVLTGLPFFMSKYKILQSLYIAWLLLVLFGRIYLGLHYFTDVVAGVILSLAVSYILFAYRVKLNRAIDRVLLKIMPPLAISRRLGKANNAL